MPRVAAHPIEEMFLRRWSPRAMSGAPLDEATLLRLFEAARWAPSGGNQQPWRFVYARAGTPGFDKLLALLNESNRAWCVRAGALVALLSRTHTSQGKPSRSHGFDAGAAWLSLALQASALGLVAHAMGGFDTAAAQALLAPDGASEVQVCIALGHPGDPALLSEHNRGREAPSDRLPLEQLVTELA